MQSRDGVGQGRLGAALATLNGHNSLNNGPIFLNLKSGLQLKTSSMQEYVQHKQWTPEKSYYRENFFWTSHYIVYGVLELALRALVVALF